MKSFKNQMEWHEDLASPRNIADRERCIFIQSSLNTINHISFTHYCLDRPLRILPFTPRQISRVIQSYQRIWYYADAYRELWSNDDAKTAITSLEDCFIAVDELDQTVALAGGKPLNASDNPEVFEKLVSVGRTYYFAELGRVTDVKNSRVGVFLFELTILNAIRKGYEEFILITAETGDIAKGTGQNPARKMYESHGYQLLTRDIDGSIIKRQCKQLRSNKQIISDWRPYYYTTADNFLKVMGLAESK